MIGEMSGCESVEDGVIAVIWFAEVVDQWGGTSELGARRVVKKNGVYTAHTARTGGQSAGPFAAVAVLDLPGVGLSEHRRDALTPAAQFGNQSSRAIDRNRESLRGLASGVGGGDVGTFVDQKYNH